MKKGFTLVELMIVIAIIALLSGIIITSLTGSKGKSRDARRVSDVNQIQLALEQYFDRCGQYPATASFKDYSGPYYYPDLRVNNGCPTSPAITLGSFISVLPKDPSNNTDYDYANNGTSLNGPTNYLLHTTLESSNAAQQNSYSETARSNDMLGTTWLGSTISTCYNGNATPPTNLFDYCVSTH